MFQFDVPCRGCLDILFHLSDSYAVISEFVCMGRNC